MTIPVWPALATLIVLSSLASRSSAVVVSVSSPTNNSQFASPAHYVASATSPQCPQGIIGMRIYLAPRLVAYKAPSNSIDTQLKLTPGNYKTVVQAWDACGGVGKTLALASDLSLQGVETQRCLSLVRLCPVLIGGSFRAEIEKIVHRVSKILFAPEVAFGGQNRGMPQQELNLFKLSAV
jgi:hypothetical protein